jgi:hypothetical protein
LRWGLNALNDLARLGVDHRHHASFRRRRLSPTAICPVAQRIEVDHAHRIAVNLDRDALRQLPRCGIEDDYDARPAPVPRLAADSNGLLQWSARPDQ